MLWLADSIAAVGSVRSSSIGANYGWNHQGVEEEHGYSDDE
jgi:hypothetical protein